MWPQERLFWTPATVPTRQLSAEATTARIVKGGWLERQTCTEGRVLPLAQTRSMGVLKHERGRRNPWGDLHL
jgi:hypothetical protein